MLQEPVINNKQAHIGTIVAGARIWCMCDGCFDANDSLAAQISFYVRAFFEAIGLGLVFFPIDLIVTIIRFAPCSDHSWHRPSFEVINSME